VDAGKNGNHGRRDECELHALQDTAAAEKVADATVNLSGPCAAARFLLADSDFSHATTRSRSTRC
jgi:hypothetical protein